MPTRGELDYYEKFWIINFTVNCELLNNILNVRCIVMLCCVEEMELATKSEHDIKILQQAISQLQLELRTTTKQARESRQQRVGITNEKYRSE